MIISRKAFGCAATILLGAIISVPMASAQEFGTNVEGNANFEQYVVRTCRALGAERSNRALTDTEADLFARCNGAVVLRRDGDVAGLTSGAELLDQYMGIQNALPQSDGLNRTNRADQFTAARLDVISNQLRGGPNIASLMPLQPYQIASTGTDIPMPSGMSRKGQMGWFLQSRRFRYRAGLHFGRNWI